MIKKICFLVVACCFLLYVQPGYADNCSGLQDCYQQSKSAALVAALIALGLSLMLDFSPIGYAKGLLEAVVGRDILTGEKLAWWQRALNTVPGGKGVGTAAKAAKAIDKASDIAKATDKASDIAKTVDKGTDIAKRVDNPFKSGTTPKASEIARWAQDRGWKKTQTPNGPVKYIDDNGVERVTIKRGSSRTPGSENPHVALRDSTGQRIDASGNPVTRKSPGNHTPIDYDL
ncbi:pre-toxin TG domain-containing protein [Roseofilum reptotaenium CS-1145]|uniref:Pre-toxin TG domain-containing protein n=1 Tax=Roseofilum reptotaenium AO1-A TaxID=1925591 RepID=A0A1L9QP71_9CYAN|nr:pre-toxin TG domain-containing protein [Roseofilum reptotaenium]MDB9516438.1 pre-toxin TG domain-containing protein [Roseofilum reptotaenium CS-1145]OJJ24436.1 hypothetical protein BI308_16635 [Roseofilum reptotaenium AO1-A]